MALNSNHTFEELGGIKCSVVEKNCTQNRAEFLKKILENNNFNVIIVKSVPPKVITKPTGQDEGEGQDPNKAVVETFIVGVSDLSFNVANAIYNRELKLPDGKVVSPSIWKQLQPPILDDLWYWKK